MICYSTFWPFWILHLSSAISIEIQNGMIFFLAHMSQFDGHSRLFSINIELTNEAWLLGSGAKGLTDCLVGWLVGYIVWSTKFSKLFVSILEQTTHVVVDTFDACWQSFQNKSFVFRKAFLWKTENNNNNNDKKTNTRKRSTNNATTGWRNMKRQC